MDVWHCVPIKSMIRCAAAPVAREALPMSTVRTLTFADLLKRYRAATGLTQEELAAKAGLSPKGISDLERGARRAPRRDTVLLLADALNLGEHERGIFEATARQRP